MTSTIAPLAALKPMPLAVAAAIAIFLFIRRRHLEPTLLIGGVLAIIAALVFGSGLVEMPNVKTIIERLSAILGAWTYLVVGVMAFLETGAFVGLVAPGETFMLLGGVVAGQGKVSLVLLIAIGWSCAVLGDVASFYAGHRLGRGFLEKHGPKVSITPERIATVDGFFERHGGKAILLGRFMGLVRAVNPFLAGASGMQLSRFLPYSILGAGAWASILLVLGFVFWHSIDRVLQYAHQGTLAIGILIVVFGGGLWLYRHFRVAEHRRAFAERVDRLLEKPALRPVAAVARPLWRRSRAARLFLRDRLTPGGLGLETTTLLAVAAVGSFVYFGYAIELNSLTLTPADRRAASIAGSLEMPWLLDVARVVTFLGSAWVVLPLLALTIAYLLRHSFTYEAAALAVGGLATWALVHVAKEVFDRDRPAGALVETIGDAYPSGHAANSIAWIAIAVVLIRRLPGLASTTLLVIVGLLLAAAIGLTRIYLRAHFLSDVLGGWGLGATLYAIAGLAAMVALHLRQNGRRSP